MGDGNQLMPESMQESNDHEKSMKNGCGNGDHANASTENQLKESQNGETKHTEYIPNQISTIATSGINTVSNDRSGQCSSQSVRKNEGMTDSKTYQESKAQCENEHKEDDEAPESKKRKLDESVSSSKIESSSTAEKCESTNSHDETESHNDSGSKEKKTANESNPNSYVPSEYGSFQNSGGVSTNTKSSSSTKEKNPCQSTDSSSAKGGIVHEDTAEK